METIRKRSRIFTICAVLVAMFCLAVGAGNTVSFERMMNQVVERYVSENNQQVASQISYRLKMGREFVSDFADTLSRMPQFFSQRILYPERQPPWSWKDLWFFLKTAVCFPNLPVRII